MKYLFFFLLLIPTLFSTGCDDEVTATGDLRLKFTANYDGQPLVMGQKYDYANGAKIFFEKTRIYLSDMKGKMDDGTLHNLSPIEVLDFSSRNTNEQAARDGIVFEYLDIPISGFLRTEFNIGLTEEQNSKKPADYPADNPLSNTEPYWADWGSYIFVTISGRADFDGDGVYEQGFVYHVGGNETRRRASVQERFIIAENQTSNAEIRFDLKKVFFDRNNVPFDIQSISQVHTDLVVMEEFADELVTAFSGTN